MVTIEINGQQIEAEEGSMVIQAADAAGIYIPRFCYHKKLSVAANCRMCLVEVEKAPKPLPACATPVVDGMKVHTRSPKAIAAQKGTMEFLLINHPLDCPICDQGGECDLQDLAVGYGEDVSRYQEAKRVVPNKNLGSLISTDMTRCIHCTRCVRFGQELAGVMELGATGRGEHMEIGTYVERTVDSELSGNMIDLCPVGALTSKPFRYSARSWELQNREGIAPHDVVGSNIDLQARRGRVMRVLPRENEAINQVWLADRDRFSYEALNSGERLTMPMIRVDGKWQETDWNTALESAATGLRRVVDSHGAEQLAGLASPVSTFEEFYLFQKLVRGLGSPHVDHRVRQLDFRNDDVAPAYPALECSIPELEDVKGALLVGSNIRKEQPLLGLRLRMAWLRGAQIAALNPLDYEFTFGLAGKIVAAPSMMPQALAGLARAVAAKCGRELPADVAARTSSAEAGEGEEAMAEALVQAGSEGVVLLGNLALSHPRYAELHALAQLIAEMTGARLGVLGEANTAAGWLAGCVPHRLAGGAAAAVTGANAAQMIDTPRRAYLLMGLEPALDCLQGTAALKAVKGADFVVALSAFKDAAADCADVLLPLAPYSETSGTFVNCAGELQSFRGAVEPLGESRPGWKILRVLGNLLDVAGFDYTSPDEVRAEAGTPTAAPSARLAQWSLAAAQNDAARSEIDLERIAEVPPYLVDSLVRRAAALQATADNPAPAVRMNAAQARKSGFAEGGTAVNVHMGQAIVQLDLAIDERVPDGCILVPSGTSATAELGGPGLARVVRV